MQTGDTQRLRAQGFPAGGQLAADGRQTPTQYMYVKIFLQKPPDFKPGQPLWTWKQRAGAGSVKSSSKKLPQHNAFQAAGPETDARASRTGQRRRQQTPC